MGEHNRHKNEAECIRKKAYELWEQGGHKQGHDFDYWIAAENAIKAQIKK